MKKIILSLSLSFLVSSLFGQINVNSNIQEATLDGTNYFLDASKFQDYPGQSDGRLLGFPATDLSQFQFNSNVIDGLLTASYFDGVLVYNIADGSNGTGTETTDPALTNQTTNLERGFYYFSNPNGATTQSVSAGKWVKVGGADLKTGIDNGKFWSLAGNSGIAETTFVDKDNGDYTIKGGNFIGTTDDKPLVFATKNVARLIIGKDGGISEQVGTRTSAFDFVLKVFGKARFSEGIVTQASTYPDYVFDNYFTGKSEVNPNYEFKRLDEVEAFIKENNHLPGVTKIDDLAKTESGYEVDNTQLSIQTLEKVEELYLHVIEQQKEIQALKAELAELKK